MYSFYFPLRGWGGTNTIISCCQLQCSMCQSMQWVALFHWTFASLPTKARFAWKDHFRGWASVYQCSIEKYPDLPWAFFKDKISLSPIPQSWIYLQKHHPYHHPSCKREPVRNWSDCNGHSAVKSETINLQRNANFLRPTFQSVREWCRKRANCVYCLLFNTITIPNTHIQRSEI